jgi:hypothetical protein
VAGWCWLLSSATDINLIARYQRIRIESFSPNYSSLLSWHYRVVGWAIASRHAEICSTNAESCASAICLKAYRKLEGGSNWDEPNKTWPLFESAIVDIQLLARQPKSRWRGVLPLIWFEIEPLLLDPLVNDLR